MKVQEARIIFDAANRLMESVTAGKVKPSLTGEALQNSFDGLVCGFEGFCISEFDYETLKPYLNQDIEHRHTIGGITITTKYRMPVRTFSVGGDVYIDIPNGSETFFVADIARAINNTATKDFYRKIKSSALYQEGEDDKGNDIPHR